jgi:hypothetical protein
MTAVPRVITADRPSAVDWTRISADRSQRTQHVLYWVEAVDGDVEFHVWADSTEAVVAVIFARSTALKLPPIFRAIRVLR